MPVVYQSINECRAGVFGETSRGVMDLVDRYAARGMDHLVGGARAIYNRSMDAYESFKDSYAMRRMNAAVNQAKHFTDADIFNILPTVEELQQAKHRMRRGIMSDPTLRQLSRDNRIEGYRGSLTDPYTHLKPEEHPDYLRVTNGVWMVGDDEITYRIDLHNDDYDPNDHDDPFNDLSIVEQDYILQTCENALAYYKQGKRDPTSKWDASL